MTLLNRLLLTFLICQLDFFPAFGQYAFYNEHYVEGKFTCELFAETGAMNCLTDLGGNKGAGKTFIKDVNPRQSRLVYGLSASVNYRRILSMRIQVIKGMVSADDLSIRHGGSMARWRYQRNLNFHSAIREVSSLVEICPLTIFTKAGSWLPAADWYLFTGLAYYHFDPHTRLGNADIQLWSLKTEGQGFKESPATHYSRHQFNIPLGTGVKFEVLSRINIRLEVNYRKLFTDYLDDVSTGYIDPTLFTKYLPPREALQAIALADRRTNTVNGPRSRDEPRGNSRNNDGYFSFALRASVVFGRQRGP